MPFTLSWSSQEVYCTFFDCVFGDDLKACMNQIQGSRHFADLRVIVIDMLNITAIDIEPHTLAIVAACDKASSVSNNRIKLAMMGDLEEALAIFSLYQLQSSGSPWGIEYFRSLEEARTWL